MVVCFVGAVVILYITSGGAAGAAHLQGRCLPRRGAEGLPMVQIFRLFLILLPVAVHVVVVPVVQLLQVPKVQF